MEIARYDILDEIESVSIDSTQKAMEDPLEDETNWVDFYNRAFRKKCDVVLIVSKDLRMDSFRRMTVDEMSELISLVSRLNYGEDNCTEVQTVSDNAELLLEIGTGKFEPARSYGDEEAFFDVIPDTKTVSFKIGLKFPENEKRALRAFMKTTASIYSYILSKTRRISASLVQLFPIIADAVPEDERVTCYRQINLSHGMDSTFGSDFFQYEYGNNSVVDGEIEATIDELVSHRIIRKSFCTEAKKIIEKRIEKRKSR